MSSFRAAVFDLDGVVTDTAKLHALAWKELVDAYLERRAASEGEEHEPFDLDGDYRRYVDGKPRLEGLRSFFQSRGLEVPAGEPDDPPEKGTLHGLATRKNQIFHELLEERGADVFTGTVELLEALRDRGVRTAVASSSRNCGPIVERAGLSHLFDARVDGETLAELGLSGKPDPDMFVEAAHRVNAGPGESAVFEDAVAGVEAGRRGDFALVVGVLPDAETPRSSLREAGADLVVPVDRMGRLHFAGLEGWFREREHRVPPVLAHWDRFEADLAGRQPVVFLDYDGTLSPIVEHPDRAVISPTMREVVRTLADRFPTTIVSGRGREDVAERVGLPNVNVAGSHGFDIAGPEGDGGTIRHQVAEDLVPVVEDVARRLERDLEGIEGAIVERKRYTVAVHHRLVREEERGRVEAAVDRALKGRSELKKTGGKRVFELRPTLDWDKGKAVLWLLHALELEGPDRVPLYVGDDTTDEDAFRALQGRGIGLLVADAPRPTAAGWGLQDVGEVEEFLTRLGGM